MTNWKLLAGIAALAAVLFMTQAAAQLGDEKGKGDKQAAGKEAAPKPATYKVEKKPFKIELALKSVLASEQAMEIAYRPSPIVGVPYGPGAPTIRTVVSHGAAVKKGELLASFDSRKIDQAIAQVETEIQMLDAGIRLAKEEHPLLEKSVPLDLEAAERSKREADEDFAYFQKTGKPEALKRVDLFVKFAAFQYDFAKEQLRQLEKMYKSQDLTEDTEQIILKRQRFFVEDAANDLRLAELERDHFLKTTLPRRELTLRDSVVKHTHGLEKARSTLPPLLSQKQKGLMRMHFERDRLAGNLELLKKDKGAMAVHAPADGVAYYGKFAAGQWDYAASQAGRLAPGGTVMPDEVFMTIVQTRPLSLRLQVDEKEVHLLKPGLTGKAKMVFNPDVKLAAKVMTISGVPAAPGKFEALVGLEIGDRPDLVPGMAVTVHFVPYAKKEALVVPASAVHEEDDKHHVEVLVDGKAQERQVTVGRSHEGQTEILEGLREGDAVLLERSTDKKAAPPKGGK